MPTLKLTLFVERACTEVLTELEMLDLCAIAFAEEQIEEVLLSLMQAGTAASRDNLRAAKGIKAVHKANSYKPHKAKQRQRTHYNKQMHMSQVLNLPFVVTGHALERFIARHYPESSLQIGLQFLQEEAKASVPIRDKTAKGDAQWKSPSGIVFVVHRDKKQPLPICVTILPIDKVTWESLAKGQLVETC